MHPNPLKRNKKHHRGRTPHLPTMNKCLCVAFDWNIPEDRLHFSEVLAGNPKGLMLDTTKTWHSQVLPSIIHQEDLPAFRARLCEALKDNVGNRHCYAELRLRDSVQDWRWGSISGRIVQRISASRVVRMVGTFSDIEDRNPCHPEPDQSGNCPNQKP